MTKRNKKHAYTLIELVISIAVAGIIAGVFAIVINAGMDTWFFVKGQRRLTMQTRGVMQRMVREIKRTKDNSDSSILNFTSTRYRFKDVDNTTIDYQQDGTDLERDGLGLLKNLANPDGLNFVYLDAAGVAAAHAEDIRAVQITIIVVDGSNRARLRSAASIRNR